MDINTQNTQPLRQAFDTKILINSRAYNALAFYFKGRAYAQWRSEPKSYIYKPEKDETTGEITWPGIPADYLPIEIGQADDAGFLYSEDDIYSNSSQYPATGGWYRATVHTVTESGKYRAKYIQFSHRLGTSDVPSQYNTLATINSYGWPAGERVYITRITYGPSFEVTNQNLINCNLDLRGFELKEKDPNFQVSEINVEFEAPEEAGLMIAALDGEMVIQYTAGYFPDDMSPVRTFYTNSNPTANDKSIKFRGEDATSYFDEHIDIMRTISSTSPASDLFYILYNDLINTTSLGVICNDATPPNYSTPSGTNEILTTRISDRRKFIAKMMNTFCSQKSLSGSDSDIYVKYVDAGIPKLTMNRETPTDIPVLDWRHISSFEYDYEQVIRTIIYTESTWKPQTSANYESVDKRTISGIVPYLINTSEPVYEAKLVIAGTETTAGRVTILDASRIQAYKTITGERELEVLAKYYKESEESRTARREDLPLEFFNIGSTLKLGESLPLIKAGDLDATNAGIKRLKMPYSTYGEVDYVGTCRFTWRGIPSLQPMDKIAILNKRTMDEEIHTIESISIDHANGGTICEIKARKGDF